MYFLSALFPEEWTLAQRFAVLTLAFYGISLFLSFCRFSKTKPKATKSLSHEDGRKATFVDQDIHAQLDAFDEACRAALSIDGPGKRKEAYEDALTFVKGICDGIVGVGVDYSVEMTSDRLEGPTLRVCPLKSLKAEIATRSRVPYALNVDDKGVAFQISCSPPSGACPFRCACHKHCFGPASGGKDPWVELEVRFDDGKVQKIPAACQASCVELENSSPAWNGLRLVHAPENRMESLKLDRAVVIFAEKHKPDTISDGYMVRQAQEAGAMAAIKVGGKGDLIYCVADPVGIPCLAIREKDGLRLIEDLASSGGAVIQAVKENDQRDKVRRERWGPDCVFVKVNGLHLLTVDWEKPLVELLKMHDPDKSTLIYEDFFDLYVKQMDCEPLLRPDASKLRRIIQSASLPGFVKNSPAMLGKMLALSGQRFRFQVQYAKFSPGKSDKKIKCAMLLGNDSQHDGWPTPVDFQAWVAHESVYLATMGYFTMLMDRGAPSLWNFIKCTNAEFFGWEADAKKILKLLSPSVGQWGKVPKESWQKNDPTWRIVDGYSETQGRLLWSVADATAESLASSKQRQQSHSNGCFAWLSCLKQH